jgi:DNA mismatch repair ATPase MutL
MQLDTNNYVFRFVDFALVSRTGSPTQSQSPSQSQSLSQMPSLTPSTTATRSQSPSPSQAQTASQSQSASVSQTPSQAQTPTQTSTLSPSQSQTLSQTPSPRSYLLTGAAVTTLVGQLGVSSPLADGVGTAATFGEPNGIALSSDGTFALVVSAVVSCVRVCVCVGQWGEGGGGERVAGGT